MENTGYLDLNGNYGRAYHGRKYRANGQLAGEGSGILWGVDSTGNYTYVVTCAHVIDEAGMTYGVLLLDGKTYEAEKVATDTRTDIGVLKIKATTWEM